MGHIFNYGYLKNWILRHFVFLKIYFLGFFGRILGYGRVDQVIWGDKTYNIKNGRLLEQKKGEKKSRVRDNNDFSVSSSEMSSRHSNSQSPNLFSPGYIKRQKVNAESTTSSSTSILIEI